MKCLVSIPRIVIIRDDLGTLRLQIWTPVNTTAFKYRLKWEKLVPLNDGDGKEYKVSIINIISM